MAETMIERAATAMARHCYKVMEQRSGDAAPDIYRRLGMDEWEELARAAIKAIRAADDDMLKAMHVAMFQEPFDSKNLPMLGAGYEAAIDAALSEGGE